MSTAFTLMSALRAVRRPVASALLVTIVLSPYGALAEALPDIGSPAQNQAGITANGGVPVIDVVAPGATGISHNKWQQFDIPTQGMVLNNATAATTSQLAGALDANPRLQGAAARLILNEVTGNQPSQLLGTLEVAGAAAKVVIANPNGITCDGCGFINTPQVQLTTGRPDFDNCALRFDVTGGQIDIGSGGLSALATRLDLIALAVRTRGTVATQGDVNIIAGRFYADAETLTLSDPGRTSARPHAPTDWDSFAIDIGQSVSAGSIQLITEGSDIGVRTAAPIAASNDITVASRASVTLNGPLVAGRDIGIYNIGAWDSTIAAEITAERDLQFIGMNVTIAPTGALIAMHGGIDLGFVGDNSDAYTEFINQGRVSAAGNVTLSGLHAGLNSGTIAAGATLEAASATVAPKFGVVGLPGTFGETFYGQFNQTGVTLANTGTLAAGRNLFLNLMENDGGSISAGGDAFVWQERRGAYMGVFGRSQHRPGTLVAANDLFLLAPDNGTSFTTPGEQTFHAHGNLYLVSAPNRFETHSSLRNDLLVALNAISQTDAARYINRDTLVADRDQIVALPSGFENQQTMQARDIRITASQVVNTPQIDTHYERFTEERFSGCKTKYAGICTADIEAPKSSALISAARHIVVDTPAFRNDGGTVLAGGDIDIATNDFLNQDRSYSARWQSVYSETPNEILLSYAAPDGSGTVPPLFGEVWWIKQASGSTELGTLPGNIQAGGTFSVYAFPRTHPIAPPADTPTPAAPSTQAPTTPSSAASTSSTPFANTVASVLTFAPAPEPVRSRFVNTGNINAAAIIVKADDIRNGFDAVKDYYRRTAAPQMPPARIDIVSYGTSGATPGLPSAYSGAALMQILPPHLASTGPFALSPSEEQAALRNALLATTGRGWILPGLTWDAATGQSPEQQQHAILAANGAAFAIEHGVAMGTALNAEQQAKLTAPALWYVNQGGRLTPTVYLPEVWQKQLLNLPGGRLDGDVGIALSGKQIDNTGFILSDGLLSIDAEELNNQKRNAHYYDKRKVKGGTLTTWGDTVQPGGFMQAAHWQLAAESIYSRSGEFVVSGTDASPTATLSAAFEAQLRAELGDDFAFKEAKDNLQVKFKAKKSGLGQLIGAVVAIVVTMYAGPAMSAMIGNMAGAAAGTTFAAATATTTAGLGNVLATGFVTQTLSSSISQFASNGRVDFDAALRSGLTASVTAGVADWTGAHIESAYGQYAVNKITAGAAGEITGTGFKTAFINAVISDASAAGANYIGNGNLGPQGSVGHALSHGVLGAISAAARGGDPAAAAIGAMTSALAAPAIDGALGLRDEARNNAVTALSMLAGGLVAESLGKDGVIAANAALNEITNNYLKHDEQQTFSQALNNCNGDRDCKQRVYERYQSISDANNEALIVARASCRETGHCTNFAQVVNDGVAFGSYYVTPDFDDPLNPWNADEANSAALAHNDAVARELIGRTLDQEVVFTPAQGRGPEGDLPSPERYSSAITSTNTDTVIEVALTGASLVLPDPSDLVVGAVLTTKAGVAIGKIVVAGGHKFLDTGKRLLKISDSPKGPSFKSFEELAIIQDAIRNNNRQRDGSTLAFPPKITTRSGIEIVANPDKTTTIIGGFGSDMDDVLRNQLDAPLSFVDQGPARPGAFNVLNVPNSAFERIGGETFWRRYNKPFLDAAITRGDDIRLATLPTPAALVKHDGTMSMFARELEYLEANGYRYHKATNSMVTISGT